jgi:hypothetical protein
MSMKNTDQTIGFGTRDLKLIKYHLFTAKLEYNHTVIKDQSWEKCLEIFFQLNVIEIEADVKTTTQAAVMWGKSEIY